PPDRGSLGRGRGALPGGARGGNAGGAGAARPPARSPGPPLLPRPAGTRDRPDHGPAAGFCQVRHAPCPARPRAVPGGDAMTLEDKLRNALRETAGEIPDEPPPLRLTPLAVSRHQARQRSANQHGAKQPWTQRHGPRWPAWAAPLAAAAAIVGLVAVLLTVVHDRPNVEGPSGQGSATASGLAGVPPYYVALTIRGNYPDPAAVD